MRRRHWLAAAFAATHGLRTSLAGAAPSTPTVQRGAHLTWPRDHGAHLEAAVEWWYLTGWLAAGKPSAGAAVPPQHGFQLTFFRRRTGLGDGLKGPFVPRQLLLAHAAFTDLSNSAHAHAQAVARWNGESTVGPGTASVTDTDLRLGNWSLKRLAGADHSRYEAQFNVGQRRLQLQLAAPREPLLQGENGWSQKGPQPAQASHYVTEPQLAVQARWGGGSGSVESHGQAWLDHEWSDDVLGPQAVGWDWLGMNLHDGSALTAFRLRDAAGRAVWAGGSWRPAVGLTRNFGAQEVQWEPLEWWVSPASAARYPVRWRVSTPVGVYVVRAMVSAQEVDARQSTGGRYWEGLSELLTPSSSAPSQQVGWGYLEMTGYAGKLSFS